MLYVICQFFDTISTASFAKATKTRVDMSKALQLAYTLHPKTLKNPLLAYSLTKPLTLFKSMYFLQVFVSSQATNTVQR